MDLHAQTDKTPKFSLDGMTFQAKVVKVYDGDTIQAVFELFGKFYRWSCRISHVDTPELKTKDEEEKKRGYVTRDKLAELILGKIVTLNCGKFDKYGRLLVEIVTDEKIVIHEWLIQGGYAKAYEGGTKEKW
jgi:micrococcal nuclease